MQFNFSQLNSLVKRLDFSKVSSPNFTPPNLKGIQVEAYKTFLHNKLKVFIFKYFPIISNSGTTEIVLDDVIIVPPDITEKEAIDKSKTYQNDIYLQVKLISHQSESSSKVVEGKIFLGHMPELSSGSNFIINGIDKFVISQIVRSPGAYILTKSQIRLSNSRKKVLVGTICELLPFQGALMLFHLNEAKKTIKLVARNNFIDNATQFPVTILFKSLGIENSTLLKIFGENDYITESLEAENFNFKDILKDQSFKSILNEIAGAKNAARLLETQQAGIQSNLYRLCNDYYNAHGKSTIELLNDLSTISLTENAQQFAEVKKQIENEIEQSKDLLSAISFELAAKFIANELAITARSTKTEVRSYRDLVSSYFFDKTSYEILPAGRYKLNHKLGLANRIFKKFIAQDICDKSGKVIFASGTYMDRDNIDKFKQLSAQKKLDILNPIPSQALQGYALLSQTMAEARYEEVKIYLRAVGSPVVTLIGSPALPDDSSVSSADFLAIVSYVMHINNKIGTHDDIDHLCNKRLRLVTELLESRIHIALSRIQRFSIDKMNALEARVNYFSLKSLSADSYFTIYSILNTKPFQIFIKQFFNSHQLTQFLDQQNPLSELTNKRKISAMGPGGIKREDPNLNVRDVHFSHYGRVCPIETPEGMNIGLILALASYAKIDKYGFLNTPFYKVVNKKITEEVHWLNATEENDFVTVEAISPRDKDNNLLSPVVARHCENVDTIDASKVDYIDVSGNQLVSISSSLIPFLEHDDANRVLMGANMQRQSVPVLKPYSPVVGTGVEHRIAQDSEVAVLAKDDGVVVEADGLKVKVKYDSKDIEDETFHLTKFARSNQNTCKNQSPLVKPNQIIKKGDILVNGHAMQNGELALGQNVVVAFTTWHGYNYEDAIILSSRLYRDDVYTSVHIQEYTCECLRTKIGDEEITRQITGILNDEKKYLDEDGLIVVGAKVKEGDILVGKISPKATTDQTPEEKLLQAIFSEKAKSVRDSSLRVPAGGSGVVSKILKFSIYQGDKLNDDVIEVVKIFITQKRKIQVGDKMAGRHGNKGIVSKIAPLEDMPYLANGTPVDILLNPLGVPRRMNIGQVLETYLGLGARSILIKKMMEFYFAGDVEAASKVFGLYQTDIQSLFAVIKAYLEKKSITSYDQAAKTLKQTDLDIILSQSGLKIDDVDIKVLTPIFAGCKHDDLVNILQEGNIDPLADQDKLALFCGKTGEQFKAGIAVGVIYMLKLDHMVDDKIYARSVGPYSKITQQPLGGKGQNGGQRFGEMEVWAMEAYGAAYNLQELLTLKSDDIHSRNSIYYSIIKGHRLPTPNIPESFKLLVKKLQAVGLKINVQYGNNKSLINCHDFIEKQLNRGSDISIHQEYQSNLNDHLSEWTQDAGQYASEEDKQAFASILETGKVNSDDVGNDEDDE